MGLLSSEELKQLLPAETSAFPSPIPTQSVSSDDLVNGFRARAVTWSPADVLDEERFRRLIDYPTARIVGPAFIGYTDRTAFRPVYDQEVRLLSFKDVEALEALRAACSAVEWEHGGSDFGDQPLVGAFNGEELVAIAGYEIWGGGIAHISVVTHPRYRRRGYGKAVVSRLTEESLGRGLVPQYRTLEVNSSSMTIARSLGLERYATTVAVRLKPSR
jgi:ribosomal protein S18 acetylase RimI-like enzyme